jgi:hypothetical protein
MLIIEIALGVFLGGWALIASVAYSIARRGRREFGNKMRSLSEDQILMLVQGARSPEEWVTMVDNMVEHNRTIRQLFPENRAAAGDPARDSK